MSPTGFTRAAAAPPPTLSRHAADTARLAAPLAIAQLSQMAMSVTDTVLLGSLEAGKRAGLAPRARIRSFASIGSEPSIMLTGPAYAAQKALERAGMRAADIDLYELNEAFASVVLRFMDAMAIAHDRINVNGGAIAMGHPLGATGAMILGTLLDELERRGAATGLATLCVGAGMGTATIIERI